MKQVRLSFFETNSSSTHAIVIPKRDVEKYDLWSSWEEYYFEFGRETYRILEQWDLKLAYIYQVLLTCNYGKDVEFPKAEDLQKFKTQVNKAYVEIQSLDTRNYYRSHDVLPDHIFEVLDFLDAKDRGIIPEDKPFGIIVPEQFDSLLRGDSYSGVDHVEYFIEYSDDDRRNSKPCADFLRKLLNDQDYLKKFIFSTESYITIGGDEYRGYNLKTVGFESDYDKEEDWKKRVEEYKKDYEVYFKGN